MLIWSVLLHCAGTALFFLRHCCIRAQNCDQHTTILDKSPWDSLKIWHVFANRSVFDALEGRVCAKWRPPSPLVNVAPKKCAFSPLIQHWEGEGEIEEGRFLAKKCRCPNIFVQDCSSTCNYCKTSLAVAKLRLDYSSITSRWEMRVNYWIGFSQLQMLMRWFGFCCRLYSLGHLKGGACSGWTWLFTSSQ